MKCLLYISLLLFLSGCKTASYSDFQTEAHDDCNASLRPPFSKTFYTAHIDIEGRQLSGLLMIKTTSEDTTHLVFSNEMGVTYFYFVFKGNYFRVVRCIKQLNRKVIINQLRKDFSLIVLPVIPQPDSIFQTADGWKRTVHHSDEIITFTSIEKCSRLITVKVISANKPKLDIALYGNQPVPDSLLISHKTYAFDIFLRRYDPVNPE